MRWEGSRSSRDRTGIFLIEWLGQPLLTTVLSRKAYRECTNPVWRQRCRTRSCSYLTFKWKFALLDLKSPLSYTSKTTHACKVQTRDRSRVRVALSWLSIKWQSKNQWVYFFYTNCDVYRELNQGETKRERLQVREEISSDFHMQK